MKITKLLLFAALIAVLGINVNSASGQNKSKNYVKVIYFHTDYRCATCTKLEKFSKETVSKYFSEEIESGKLKFEAINFEEESNEHYVDEYDLYNKSLIIIRYENGKKKDWKNLDKIWEYVSSKTKYYNYVKKEIKDYLKG